MRSSRAIQAGPTPAPDPRLSRAGDPASEVALVASARRAFLLRTHGFRLRREDLEDCYGQATLELLKRAREGGGYANRRHLESVLEARFLSRINDRRRALTGRSGIQAALEGAVPIAAGAGEDDVQIIDRRAELERLVLLRHELRRIRELASLLSDDQRLVIAAQIAQCDRVEFCRRYGWSAEKYRKVALRGRRRLRELLDRDEQPVPGPGPQSEG
jgi:DNA-directed RNA polymerase specialized sigma24 family protein